MQTARRQTRALAAARRYALWLTTILVAAVFFWTGMRKLLGLGGWVVGFARWGFPPWFRLLIGGVELVSAVLLLIPPVATLGAIAIAVTMVGAVGTLLMHGARDLAAPLLNLVLALVIAWARRRQFGAAMRRLRVRPGTAAASS